MGNDQIGATVGDLGRYFSEFVGGGLRWQCEWWGRHNYQDHADCDGMADGKRAHLRADAGFVDTDRRDGLGIRLLFVNFIYNGPRRRSCQRGCDLYAFGHDRLQHGGGFYWSRGKQGDSDGDSVAHGGRDHVRSDSGFCNIERWHGVGERHVHLDRTNDSASNGDKQSGCDLFRDGLG